MVVCGVCGKEIDCDMFGTWYHVKGRKEGYRCSGCGRFKDKNDDKDRCPVCGHYWKKNRHEVVIKIIE